MDSQIRVISALLLRQDYTLAKILSSICSHAIFLTQLSFQMSVLKLKSQRTKIFVQNVVSHAYQYF